MNNPTTTNKADDRAYTDASGVFEIFNPSDTYTIKGPFMACAIAVVILGRGAYGIPGTPVLFGWDEWLTEHGITDLTAYVNANADAIATALDSVLIGDERDRKEVESALAMLPHEKWDEWLAVRHDKKRSSMNDIGETARRLAARLRRPKGAWRDNPEPTDLSSRY